MDRFAREVRTRQTREERFLRASVAGKRSLASGPVSCIAGPLPRGATRAEGAAFFDSFRALRQDHRSVPFSGRPHAIAAMVEGRSGIWLRLLAAGEAHLLPGTEDARYPFWSPDSRFL